MKKSGKLVKKVVLFLAALSASVVMTATFLLPAAMGATWLVTSKDPVTDVVMVAMEISGADTEWLNQNEGRRSQAEHIIRAVIREGGRRVLGSSASMVFDVYRTLSNTITVTKQTLQPVINYVTNDIRKDNSKTEGVLQLVNQGGQITAENTIASGQVRQEREESDPMMRAYLENNLPDFEQFLDSATEETVFLYLNMAIDQQRGEFIAAILKRLPENWNADELAEELIEKHVFHALSYVLEYTSAEKHPGWMADAIKNGDADIVSALYKRLPDTDAAVQADLAYQNMHNADTSMAKLRHITVFEVFRPDLPASTIKAYYDQAVKDGEHYFVKYISRNM